MTTLDLEKFNKLCKDVAAVYKLIDDTEKSVQKIKHQLMDILPDICIVEEE